MQNKDTSTPRIQNWSFSAAILNFGGHIEIQLLINLFIQYQN